MRPYDYWASGAGLSQVTPHGLPLPEGQDFPAFLAALIGERKVVEFGSGPGRLAALLDAERYVGVDICATALERARETAPKHQFKLIDESVPLPDGDVTLCHTVLLHVPDDLLLQTIDRFNSNAVIVSEILGRKWRRDGEPPVFNREAIDYVLAFGKFGYVLASHVERPYPYYRDTNLTVIEFRRAEKSKEPTNDGPLLDASSPARPRRTKS